MLVWSLFFFVPFLFDWLINRVIRSEVYGRRIWQNAVHKRLNDKKLEEPEAQTYTTKELAGRAPLQHTVNTQPIDFLERIERSHTSTWRVEKKPEVLCGVEGAGFSNNSNRTEKRGKEPTILRSFVWFWLLVGLVKSSDWAMTTIRRTSREKLDKSRADQ